MFVENRFNLIDEPWILVADAGMVSLRQLFSNQEYRALGGTPIQKIALTKFLLAIAQAASTPEDESEWASLRPEGLAQACLEYLDRWYDRFFLYGERPFLQMPAIKTAVLQKFGAVLAEVSTGNTTVLTQSQVEKILTDADKALLIVQLMGFGLGGKKTDNSVVLSPGYQGKSKPTGQPGTFIGYSGYLHSFLQGTFLQETLWLNLFSRQEILNLGAYPQGIGTSPWERMPEGESCPVAEVLKSSLMGRLLPLSRFCLLAEDGLHYSEGIFHPGYKEGGRDPSVALDSSPKVPKVLWTDPGKRPWRSLPALLNFLSSQAGNGFDCYQLRLLRYRAREQGKEIGIWSGGLRVKSNAGEQYVSGSGDFLESLVQIPCNIFGATWFANLSLEMGEMDKLSKKVYGSVLNYFKSQKMNGAKQAVQSSNLFWQLCERRFQDLLIACESPDLVRPMRPAFARCVDKAYDTYCPRETARQIDAWAHNRPNLHSYLNSTKE